MIYKKSASKNLILQRNHKKHTKTADELALKAITTINSKSKNNEKSENAENTDMPTILDSSSLPGPLCMNKLSKIGIFKHLDNQSGFSDKQSKTVAGRSEIIKKLLPKNTIACLYTSAWIWLGGSFPVTLDVLSQSHYRSRPHGRPIHVYTRKIIDGECVKIGNLLVTTPTRTVCDIALTQTESEITQSLRYKTIYTLMENYMINIKDCSNILNDNHHFPSSVAAREWLESIMQLYIDENICEREEENNHEYE